ncbi:MAG: diaminopimelate dehydrogenase [Candidatus Bathyarchaeota archaeon]|nr:diaminopimelate dehydrogenase [Candidatus Bathyarchaeota archaeon]
MKQIRIGIVGYGNVGKGVELAVEQNPDMILKGIFTRREPATISAKYSASKVIHVSEIKDQIGQIDVAILCGGSATDLLVQGPKFASMFNTVDSFDTHAKIPEYFDSVDKAARNGGNTCVISTGWDPGLFSLLRVYGESTLPRGKNYTFWGPGVSQGHSNAIKIVRGVKNAIQYTIPIKEALERVRTGENPDLTKRELHRRTCYVVPEDDADLERIEREIVTMPNFFEPYDTEVNFISEKEMVEEHSRMPHGGFVLRSGITGDNNRQLMEFRLTLDSNPEFTGSIITAYARATYRLNQEDQIGAKTVFDVPPAYLSIRSPEELRKKQL